MTPDSERKERILVVEDEADLSSSLAYALTANGYETKTADRGKIALAALDTFRPDLVLLDLMLPDISGLDVCRELRKKVDTEQPAVIVVSARAQEIDRVVGLEVGADDYVVKPFSVRELMLRVEARLKTRRAVLGVAAAGTETRAVGEEEGDEKDQFILRNLRVDGRAYRLFVNDEELHVSPIEMKLLLFLFRAPGHTRTRRELLTEVWGYHPDVASRTVDTHIKRLRDKLGAAGPLLETVRGVGYRLSDAHAVVANRE